MVEPHRRAALDALRRDVAAGEVRPDADVELLADLLVGPLVLRAAAAPGADLGGDLPAPIVDTVLSVAAARR